MRYKAVHITYKLLLKFYDIFINLKLNAIESHPVHKTTAREKRKALQKIARDLSRDARALQRRPPVHPQLAGRQREAARRGKCGAHSCYALLRLSKRK